MQLSYGYFLCPYLHRPTKTNHPFLLLSLKDTHTRMPFPSSPFLTLNLANKRLKGLGDVETVL